MGGRCSCMSSTETISVPRDAILHTQHIDEEMKHWQLWSQLDLHDEAKMFQLSLFIHQLMEKIVPENTFQSLELTADVDLEEIELHDTIHLEWPLTVDQVQIMIDEFNTCADGIHIPLPKQSFLRLLDDCTKFYVNEPNLISLQIPHGTKLTVVGDLHGQLQDLLHIFSTQGIPSPTNWFLFNGDFLDRGTCSLEICAILFAFKSIYPESIHLNRGNHEDPKLYRLYTFHREATTKYDRQVESKFHPFCNALPLGYTINDTIFVVHGGLPEHEVTLEAISSISRGEFSLHERKSSNLSEGMHLMQDLLWSDPQSSPGYSVSSRGAGILFGPDICSHFLDLNRFKLLIRSHEAVRNGYMWPYQSTQCENGKVNPTAERLSEENQSQLLTIFSCSNYCNSNNKGAIITFDDSLQYVITTYQVKRNVKINMGLPAYRSIEDHNRHNIMELIVQKKNKLKCAFETLDTERTGHVTMEQWGHVMKNVLEIDLDWIHLAPLFVKTTSKNTFEYGEFLESYRVVYHDAHHNTFDSLYSNRKEMEMIFCFFDTDNSGTITLSEFQHGCDVLNDHLPENERWNDPVDLFRQLNIRGSSTISINEFFEAFRLVDSHPAHAE